MDRALRAERAGGTHPACGAWAPQRRRGDITTPKIADYEPVTGTVSFGNCGNRHSSAYQVGGDLTANLTHGVQLTAGYVQGLPGPKESSVGSTYYQGNLGASVVTAWGIYGFSAEAIRFRLGKATEPLFPSLSVHRHIWVYAGRSNTPVVS